MIQIEPFFIITYGAAITGNVLSVPFPVSCFKEGSLASRHMMVKAVAEEFFSNPKFYMKIELKNLNRIHEVHF
jgi:hypothetical protein